MPAPILLVDGIFHEQRLVPSCGIASLAAFLRNQGFEVDLFAPNNRRLTEFEAANYIYKRAPRILGVSLLSILSHKPVEQLLRHLESFDYKGFVCVGGHWATLYYERILAEMPSVDCVVIGDGEDTCSVLFSNVLAGAKQDTSPGTVWRNSHGGTIFNGPGRTRHLDEYPLIATDLIGELVDLYGRQVRVGLVSSRGCYADCTYCSVKAFTKLSAVKPYRMRSVKQIADEIQMVYEKYGTVNFTLEDDNFLVPGRFGLKRACEFRDALRCRELRINLTLQTRPECITLESIKVLKEAGLRDIFIGVESFDQPTLDLYHRNNQTSESINALDILESMGFSCNVDSKLRVRIGSMIFHPYITLDALYKQAAFFRRYQIPSKKLLKRLRPSGDVKLWRQLNEAGLVGEDGEYVFLHAEVAEVYRTLRRFYDEFITVREDIGESKRNAVYTD